ncbi:MAG: murein biosynthesis integral rane protein MurJ [Pseudomonadota bacterium]
MIRGFLTVGGWTFASRVIGFVRDVMMAATLGTGPVAEAFYAAFALPNMFRAFFAEGAFNTAFVPMFARRLQGGEDAGGFARDAFSGLAAILFALTLIANLVMPWLVLAMYSGFAGDQRFDLAVGFTRVTFVYLPLIALAALLAGVLNAAGRLAVPAAAPVLLNVVLIGAMVAADAMGWPVGQTLAWAVPVAGVVQFALVSWAAARAGFAIRPRLPRLSPEMRELAVVAAPAFLAAGVVQVNLLVGRQVASHYEGAVAWLYNADRLYQLPLAVVGIAVGVVLLPDLARRLRAGDEDGGRHSFSRAAEFALALTLPAAVALVVIALPLVSVLFERGRFGPADSAATAQALAVYGLGLPAFVLQKVLQPLYFARGDTRRPFRFALVAMVANAGLAVGLSPLIGFLAAAWGTTIASWLMVAQLWAGSRAMGLSAAPDARLRSRAPRIALAAAVMGGALWAAQGGLAEALATPGLRYGAMAALIGGGIAAYALAAQITGALRWSELRAALRR